MQAADNKCSSQLVLLLISFVNKPKIYMSVLYISQQEIYNW